MAKKNKMAAAADVQRDDALFEALGKNKKRRKRRIRITVLSTVLVLAVTAAAGIVFLRRQVREQFSSSRGEVLSYAVTTGSISTLVSGSGIQTARSPARWSLRWVERRSSW